MTETRSVPESDEIRIGISSCLLGEEVRYDGGHKLDHFLVRTVGPFVRYVPVCPEVGIGMSTPREAVRLVRIGGDVRMVGIKSGDDHTENMRRWAERKARDLERLNLSGYILKKDSPSCGMERVKLYSEQGPASREGRGLFAEALMARLPLLPLEEEGRLNDPRLRENFFERVFAYRRLRTLFSRHWTIGRLVEFHTREKLLLLAHDPKAYQELGRLTANAKKTDRTELAARYQEIFMHALARKATTGRHANVLEHMMGYLHEGLSAAARQELVETLHDFRKGLIPLIVPVTLVRHAVRVLGIGYLASQSYLQPHPKELMLRNHV